MKKSTYRKIKAVGIFIFLILFGAFFYLLNKTFTNEQNEMALSPESNPQDLDLPIVFPKNKPMGFDYQSTAGGQSF